MTQAELRKALAEHHAPPSTLAAWFAPSTTLLREWDMMSSIKIGIKRLGDNVQISMQCHSEYHAIEAYDRLVEGAKKGEITIGLKTTAKAEAVLPIP